MHMHTLSCCKLYASAYNENMTKNDDTTIAAWVSLVRAHRAAFAQVETSLKDAGFPPLAWYDALLELCREPKGLRLQDMESRMLLPQYNISRLADRLAAESLVKKEVDPCDARSRVLTITGEGRELLKSMWPVYAKGIEKAIGIKLNHDEAVAISKLLKKVTD